MNRRPEVCVLPVAGLSTRNLPTTKVLHKGFMTLDNKPVIQYAIDACAEAGIKEVKVYDVAKTEVSFIMSDIWKYKGVIILRCRSWKNIWPKRKRMIY